MTGKTTITGGASTMSRQPSRRPTLYGVGNDRTISAQGCVITLAGGKQLIDFPMGQHGPLFGYSHPKIRAALQRAILGGEATSYAPAVEDRVAAQIGEVFPDVEQVRFGKNGSDVCAAAVRLARAIAGRDRIAAYGYHGNDAEFVHPPQNRGVPMALQKLVSWFDWGYPDLDEVITRDVACVIVEVPPTDDDAATRDFLLRCKAQANYAGALFILDEVVTGFRLALRGAAGYYNIQPDLYCWGKALSNGYAVSALGGRTELMQEFQNGVFFSGTFFDDPLGLAVANATLGELGKREQEIYAHLYDLGNAFKSGFNDLAQTHSIPARCIGQAPRTVLEFDDDATRRAFNLICLNNGVLFDRPNFISLAMTRETIDLALDVVARAFAELAREG